MPPMPLAGVLAPLAVAGPNTGANVGQKRPQGITVQPSPFPDGAGRAAGEVRDDGVGERRIEKFGRNRVRRRWTDDQIEMPRPP